MVIVDVYDCQPINLSRAIVDEVLSSDGDVVQKAIAYYMTVVRTNCQTMLQLSSRQPPYRSFEAWCPGGLQSA